MLVKMSLMRVVGLCQTKMNYHNLRQKSINLIECQYKLKPYDDEDDLREPDGDDEQDLYDEDNVDKIMMLIMIRDKPY